MLDSAGIEILADMQGRSLRPILDGADPSDWRKSFYYHYYEYPGVHNVPRHFGVRTDRYKLIHYYGDPDTWELIDLQTDPHEYRNVYDDPVYVDVVKQMKTELVRLRREVECSDGE